MMPRAGCHSRLGCWLRQLIVTVDRHAVAGQVEALAALPARPEDRRHDRGAGRPAVGRQRRVGGDVPGLRGDGVLAVARAFEAEREFAGRARPRRRRDREDRVRPGRGDAPPAALDLAAPEFRGGEILFEQAPGREERGRSSQPSTRFSGTRSKQTLAGVAVHELVQRRVARRALRRVAELQDVLGGVLRVELEGMRTPIP